MRSPRLAFVAALSLVLSAVGGIIFVGGVFAAPALDCPAGARGGNGGDGGISSGGSGGIAFTVAGAPGVFATDVAGSGAPGAFATDVAGGGDDLQFADASGGDGGSARGGTGGRGGSGTLPICNQNTNGAAEEEVWLEEAMVAEPVVVAAEPVPVAAEPVPVAARAVPRDVVADAAPAAEMAPVVEEAPEEEVMLVDSEVVEFVEE